MEEIIKEIEKLRIKAEIEIDEIKEWTYADDGLVDMDKYDFAINAFAQLRDYIENIEFDLNLERDEDEANRNND